MSPQGATVLFFKQFLVNLKDLGNYQLQPIIFDDIIGQWSFFYLRPLVMEPRPDLLFIQPVAMNDPQALEVRPVITAVPGSGHRLSGNSDLAIDKLRGLVPIIDALDMGDDGFAVALALADSCGLPISFLVQIPAIVIKDRFARLGVRENLDPALYPIEARYPAQYDGLLQFRIQLAACALRCFFNSEATRSDGCAPWPIQ